MSNARGMVAFVRLLLVSLGRDFLSKTLPSYI